VGILPRRIEFENLCAMNKANGEMWLWINIVEGSLDRILMNQVSSSKKWNLLGLKTF